MRLIERITVVQLRRAYKTANALEDRLESIDALEAAGQLRKGFMQESFTRIDRLAVGVKNRQQRRAFKRAVVSGKI